MERILLFFVVLVLVEGFKYHSKFQKSSEDSGHIRNVSCNNTHDRIRNELIDKSRCGEPKEIFVELTPQASYLQVTPSAVWVKRCVGMCDFDEPGSQCVPTKTRMEPFPVRIFNVKTSKDTCSTYGVEVHESCKCCTISAGNCSSRRVYNPRKCSCQCPNMEERRKCLKKRNQHMRWNRYKCACEEKRRPS